MKKEISNTPDRMKVVFEASSEWIMWKNDVKGFKKKKKLNLKRKFLIYAGRDNKRYIDN